MRFLLELVAAIFLTIAAILAFAKGANADGIITMKAVAESSKTPTAKTGAAYIMLMNHGPEPDKLIGITSEVAASAMLHLSKDENGVMRMEDVNELEVAPGQTIDMATEGYHIMLTGLKAPLKKGDKIDLVLRFAKAGDVAITAEVGVGVKLGTNP